MPASTTKTMCGFIGLGSQGAPMAQRMIDAGFPTILWARRPEALDAYRDTNAQYAASIAELAVQVDYLGICVVNDEDVRQVCAKVFPAMRSGGYVAIHSTIHPDTCRQLAEEAGIYGLHLIDAPVSGGSPAAEAGTLTVMVGGRAEYLDFVRPVLATFGQLIVHLGDVGAGQVAKLINNTMLAANMAVANNALNVGADLGLHRDMLVELLQASSGRSFGLDIRARMSSPDSFRHGAQLLAKDVALLSQVLGKSHPSTEELRKTAMPFISYATGQ